MAFATKKCALSWANDYLEKTAEKGTFVDPIHSGTVQAVKRFGYWDFGLALSGFTRSKTYTQPRAKVKLSGK